MIMGAVAFGLTFADMFVVTLIKPEMRKVTDPEYSAVQFVSAFSRDRATRLLTGDSSCQ